MLINKITSLFLFLATVLTALFLAKYLLEAGLQGDSTLIICVILVVVIIIISERLLPYKREWNHAQNDIQTDILHMLFSNFLPPEVFKYLFMSIIILWSQSLTEHIGFDLWPNNWNLWFQLLLALLVVEFANYWSHRLFHEIAVLWRFHSVHHSCGRLYWLNSMRFHPIEFFISYGILITPLLILGVNLKLLTMFMIFSSILGLLQHSNIDFRLGPLNWIFSMTELHRWHHSPRIKESNSNYGLNLIIWDILFRTRFLPKDRNPDQAGIDTMPHYPKTYLRQLIVPFAWQKTLADSAKEQSWDE